MKSANLSTRSVLNTRDSHLREKGALQLIWFLVLLIAIVAIVGGIALSKFLFLVLIVALLVAVLGARSA